MENVRFCVRARGVVQGVGFRDFVRRHARTLGVTGFARNLQDGSVEVVAEGQLDAVAAFLNVVKRGSPSGRVDSIEIAWEAVTGEYTTFLIR